MIKDHAMDYFVIWNPAAGPPTHRHLTHDKAVEEAERLARLHPGQSFHVLGALGVACQPEPPSIYKSTRLGVFMDVPF